MQQIMVRLIILFTVPLLSCKSELHMDTEMITKNIWETVKAHNEAWSEHEDINEQLKFVHDEIIFVSPPFKEIMKGKAKYKEAYEKWMKHAEVDYFLEMNPVIKIYGGGNCALVTYHIEMSFSYDDRVENSWKGIDMMTLAKENGHWLIRSDMYARNAD